MLSKSMKITTTTVIIYNVVKITSPVHYLQKGVYR